MTSPATIDPRSLRNVLGCYATGVAVITARGAGGAHVGVTVNSFSSVSLDPPLVLFSLARKANVLESLMQADRFAVNILAQSQIDVSNRFARPSTAQFVEGEFREGAGGCALLHASLAQIECDKASVVDGGDHLIFLGGVTSVALLAPAHPLLFYRGAYGTYQKEQWSQLPAADGSLTEFVVPGWG